MYPDTRQQAFFAEQTRVGHTIQFRKVLHFASHPQQAPPAPSLPGCIVDGMSR